jgi:hypothetical protein
VTLTSLHGNNILQTHYDSFCGDTVVVGGLGVWLWLCVWWVTPMATVKGEVKGGQGNILNCCWYLLMEAWRSHLTWSGFEHSYTEVPTLPVLCATIPILVLWS